MELFILGLDEARSLGVRMSSSSSSMLTSLKALRSEMSDRSLRASSSRSRSSMVLNLREGDRVGDLVGKEKLSRGLYLPVPVKQSKELTACIRNKQTHITVFSTLFNPPRHLAQICFLPKTMFPPNLGVLGEVLRPRMVSPCPDDVLQLTEHYGVLTEECRN